MMRALLGCLASALAHGATITAQQPMREFRIDAAHSSVEFEIPFMYSHVRGRFDDVRGTILLPDSGGAGIASSAAMAVIRTASINTGSAHRDEHLRSSDFFDAGQFPTIIFRSDGVSGGGRDFVVTGTLAIHGHVHAVTIPFHIALFTTHDPHSVVLAELTGATTIARRDFGIVGGDAHNPWFDKLRSATMGDSVRVMLDVHLWAPDVDSPDTATRAMLASIDSLGIDSSVAHLRAAFARDSARVMGAQGALDVVGQTLIARRRVREGFLLLHALARLLPGSADAAVSVGIANAFMDDTARANTWYRQALALDSLNTRAYVYLYGRYQAGAPSARRPDSRRRRQSVTRAATRCLRQRIARRAVALAGQQGGAGRIHGR